MRRSIAATVLALSAAFGAAGAVAAQPISEPASCQGYLASYSNPNYAWILENIVQPAAADQGVTVGQLLTQFAYQHGGSLEACIP